MQNKDEENNNCLFLLKYIYISMSLIFTKMGSPTKSISFYVLFFSFGKMNCDFDLTLLVVENMDETVCGKDERKTFYQWEFVTY